MQYNKKEPANVNSQEQRMSNHRPIRRMLFAAIVLTLFTAFLTSAYAVNIEFFPGFDGAMKSTVWSPIGVKLVNPGGKTVEGVLEVQQDTTNRRSMPVCSAKVSLPGNSTKLYYVYTRRPEYGGNTKISLMQGSRVLVAREINIATIASNDKLIVSLGDRASKLAFMSGEKIPRAAVATPPPSYGLSGQTDSTIQAAALSPLMLPDRPAAYQGVDLMIIGDLGGISPDPKALQAISMWVASGGTLVVSTGPDFRSFQTEFFEELLPVTVTGATSVPTLNAIASISRMEFPGGPVAVTTSVPKPGICTQVLREGAVPIFAERRYGAGRVVFLAFDYKASPFRDWNGQVEFWKSMLMTSISGAILGENLDWMQDYGSYHPGHYTSSTRPATLSSLVQQNPAIKAPSFNIIALYLLAYLVFLVPVNYWYLKKKRRMELAWISTPVIVLLFTLGAYAIGYTMKGGKIDLSVATIIEGSTNARYARVISNASLFSPARRSYNVDIKDPFAIGQCVPEEPKELMPTAYLGEKTTIENIDMAMWSAKTIESVSGVDLGGPIACNLTLAGNQVRGTVTNNTSFNLTDCAIHFGGSEQVVGSLPRGRTITVTAKSAPSSSGSIYGGQARDIRTRLQSMAAMTASSSSAPTLVGFAERDAPYGLSGSRGKVTADTCVMIRLDVSTGGTRIFSPNMIMASITKSQNTAPATPVSVQTSSGRRAGTGPPPAGSLAMNISPGGFFVVMYQLPVSGGLDLSSLTLRASSYPYSSGSGSPRIRYSLGTNSGAWEAVKISGSGDVPNPKRYLQAGNRIMVRVESLDSSDVIAMVGISAIGKQR